jgi:hypothetical protein
MGREPFRVSVSAALGGGSALCEWMRLGGEIECSCVRMQCVFKLFAAAGSRRAGGSSEMRTGRMGTKFGAVAGVTNDK